jgi:hypothetical protein
MKLRSLNWAKTNEENRAMKQWSNTVRTVKCQHRFKYVLRPPPNQVPTTWLSYIRHYALQQTDSLISMCSIVVINTSKVQVFEYVPLKSKVLVYFAHVVLNSIVPWDCIGDPILVRYRSSNQFFSYAFQFSAVLFIFSLLRMWELLWLSSKSEQRKRQPRVFHWEG